MKEGECTGRGKRETTKQERNRCEKKKRYGGGKGMI
jgi:hypothetical protein